MSNNNTSPTPVVAAVPTYFIAIAPSSAPSMPMPTPSSNAVANNMHSNPSFTFLIIAFVVLFIIRLWQVQKDRKSILDINISNNNGNNGTNNNNAGGVDGNADFGLKFSSQERIELYNQTFDSNGNQLILEDRHIIKTKTTTISNDDDDDNVFVDIELAKGNNNNDDNDNGNDNDNGDDPSIYLPVESERRLTHLDDDDDDNDDTMKNEIMTTSTDHTSSTRSLCLDLDHHNHNENNNHNKEKQKQMISGTCIICFDEFMKDDVIVWSQDPKCSHIYHKECMVSYLASNAQRSKIGTLNVSDNPCPTCRQNYCTVQDDDLVKLMIKKASTVVRTTTSSRHIADNNDVITTITTYPLITIPDAELAEAVSAATAHFIASSNNATAIAIATQ